jgi:hypothetical protein
MSEKRSLRDYFAAQVAAAYIVSSQDFFTKKGEFGMEFEEYVAAQAYLLADAMIKERKMVKV